MLLLWMIGKMLVIFFDFFLTTKELRNDEPERDRPKLSSVMGATFLVREKYSRADGI